MKVIKESLLNEGAGAGYSLTGTGKFTEVTNINIISDPRNTKWGSYVEFSCNAKGYVEDLAGESYMYSGRVSQEVPITAKHGIYYLNDIEDFNNKTIVNALKQNILDEFSFNFVYGGGWSHATWDGSVADEKHPLEVGSYADVQLTDAYISDDDVVDYIDKAVTGDNILETYDVYDEDDDCIEYFDNEEEAISFAKENGGVIVVHNYWEELYNGDIDDISDYEEIVWELENESLKGRNMKIVKESNMKDAGMWAVVDDASGEIIDTFYSKEEAIISAEEDTELRDNGVFIRYRGPFSVEPYYESLKEDIENLDRVKDKKTIQNVVMADAEEESKERAKDTKKFIDPKELKNNKVFLGAKKQPTPKKAEVPNAKIKESLNGMQLKENLDDATLFDLASEIREMFKELYDVEGFHPSEEDFDRAIAQAKEMLWDDEAFYDDDLGFDESLKEDFTKNDRDYIIDKLDSVINDIFYRIQKREGITSGDIDVPDAFELDKNIENIATIIERVIGYEKED